MVLGGFGADIKPPGSTVLVDDPVGDGLKNYVGQETVGRHPSRLVTRTAMTFS
jgi:hypothetical protein